MTLSILGETKILKIYSRFTCFFAPVHINFCVCVKIQTEPMINSILWTRLHIKMKAKLTLI